MGWREHPLTTGLSALGVVLLLSAAGPTLLDRAAASVEEVERETAATEDAKRAAAAAARRDRAAAAICGPHARADWTDEDRTLTCTGNGGRRRTARVAP